jgi:transcriptional regulator with XRE-family HTH domain
LTIGERIQNLRLKLGYDSQIDFAKACGLTPAAICQYENNARKPSSEALMKIAKTCGVSIEYILGDDKPADNDSELSKAFFRNFEKLDEKDQKVVLDIMKSLKKKQ